MAPSSRPICLRERRAAQLVAAALLAPTLLACTAAPEARDGLAGEIPTPPLMVAALSRAETVGKTPEALAPPPWLPASATAAPLTILAAALAPTADPPPAPQPDFALAPADPPATPSASAAPLLVACAEPDGSIAPCRPVPRLPLAHAECPQPAAAPCPAPLAPLLLAAADDPEAADDDDRRLKLKIYEDDEMGDIRVVYGKGGGLGLSWVLPLSE